MNQEDEFDFEETALPQEAFHIELDLYETGDYSNLLVIRCNDAFIIVGNNEHICTIVKTCNQPECWEQQDGSLEDETIEKLVEAITGYISAM